MNNTLVLSNSKILNLKSMLSSIKSDVTINDFEDNYMAFSCYLGGCAGSCDGCSGCTSCDGCSGGCSGGFTYG